SDPDAKLERLAEVVVTGLGSPDLLALQEVQDRDGREDSGVVEADSTFSRLAKAIVDAGGPVYAWRQLDPENNADGGAPGSNIRVGLMYRPERLDMVDSAAASPEEGGRAPRIVVEDGRPSLRPSPARLRHPSFDADEATGFGGTRKPLFVQARFRGEDLFLVVLHLISRRKDSPPMGAVQPQALHTEPRRLEQARQVRLVVDQILGADPDARVIVLGDVNDFPGRPVLRMLAGDRLENLVERIPETDRYTFNFRGNSQTLDHILVSRTLAAGAEVDIVHACADFAHVRAASDHDPVVARLRIGGEPKKSDAQP
ncbi:MAG: endonuclease/exonuclease/phosphatase family protein, partial [Holophagales bacterium]|nr:endonuclease/exonuclease/phosphatase family protein [Holophagales bacterium]